MKGKIHTSNNALMGENSNLTAILNYYASNFHSIGSDNYLIRMITLDCENTIFLYITNKSQ